MPSRFAYAEALALCLVLVAVPGCPHAKGTTSMVLRIEVPDADADADVYIDGHYVGQVRALGTPTLGSVQLTAGVHRVEVRKAGRFPVQRTVKVDGASPEEFVLTAELLTDPK